MVFIDPVFGHIHIMYNQLISGVLACKRVLNFYRYVYAKKKIVLKAEEIVHFESTNKDVQVRKLYNACLKLIFLEMGLYDL